MRKPQTEVTIGSKAYCYIEPRQRLYKGLQPKPKAYPLGSLINRSSSKPCSKASTTQSLERGCLASQWMFRELRRAAFSIAASLLRSVFFVFDFIQFLFRFSTSFSFCFGFFLFFCLLALSVRSCQGKGFKSRQVNSQQTNLCEVK